MAAADNVAEASPEISADLQLSRPGITELASGVDALYLSGSTVIPEGLVRRLDAARRQAEEASTPLPFDLGGHELQIAPHGWGKYRFLLVDELGRIGVSTAAHIPAIRIQPRAELLHTVGPSAVVAGYRALVEAECGAVHLSVNRLDLFADVQGLALCAADRERFVCRAVNCRTFEENSSFRGFQFGWRTTKTFSARIYDKTADVERHGSDWWFAIWGDDHLPGVPVYRVEFEIGRKGITDFGLDTPAEVLTAKGDLWRYATSDWLSLRTRTDDGTRSRWPVSPEWRRIQQASLADRSLGLERIAAGRARGSLRRLMPPLAGYLAAFAAVVGTEEIDDTLGALDQHLRADEISRRRAFRDRISERRTRSAAP